MSEKLSKFQILNIISFLVTMVLFRGVDIALLIYFGAYLYETEQFNDFLWVLGIFMGLATAPFYLAYLFLKEYWKTILFLLLSPIWILAYILLHFMKFIHEPTFNRIIDYILDDDVGYEETGIDKDLCNYPDGWCYFFEYPCSEIDDCITGKTKKSNKWILDKMSGYGIEVNKDGKDN